MSGIWAFLTAGGATICAFGLGACAVQAAMRVRTALKRKARATSRLREGLQNGQDSSPEGSWVVRYMRALSMRLYAGATNPLSSSVRNKKEGKTRTGSFYERECKAAGVERDVPVAAFCEASMRLGWSGALLGGLIGCALSTQLALLLACVGALVGKSLPARELKRLHKARADEAQHRLSEMLEVVALGLRSGLTFDRAFALYGSHFSSGFARSCELAHKRWSLGLATREEALRDLARAYDCDQLGRVVESIVRDLRLGSALATSMEEAARQSRAVYKAGLEERVAKAPVKMMLPTGALILPAMLLLVMGPILLELAGGF